MDGVPREEFNCAICQELLAYPVTLSCGHTFDRDCLERLVTAGSGVNQIESNSAASKATCPFDRKPIKLPLPEIDVALQRFVRIRFPHEIDNR
mmetsp:Transcript_65489/g.102253  ORF Transcript_65489/g.102253 Transcript_65489/m.102253 type:complete len:93 (-) Transcript_65489:20-298(-)